MRVLNRRFKILLFGSLMFFLGYFTVNFVHTGSYLEQPPQIIEHVHHHRHEPQQKQEEKDEEQQPPLAPQPLPPPGPNDRPVEHGGEQIIVANQNKSSLIDKNTSPKTRYLAFDGGGFGSVNTDLVRCANGLEVEVTSSNDKWHAADIFYFHMSIPKTRPSTSSYVMVYTMESEVHSFGGNTWSQADFRMWYDLDRSFPEPATYFDVHVHLVDLLSKPTVELADKDKDASVVWVVSNCNAYNAREKLMQELMNLMPVHSYGLCLRNRFNHTSEHMKGNIELFSKYKFVIAIENSNCHDYVTEKLAHAVASGSIPIVAGRDSKPNYLRFMPKNSYINIYDFKTVEDLVKHLNLVGSDKNEYEKYIAFKRKHNYTRDELLRKSLDELITLARDVLGYENEREFFDGLVSKEKSENKLCKIARYLHATSKQDIERDIKSNRINRPESSEACLPRSNFVNDFKLVFRTTTTKTATETTTRVTATQQTSSPTTTNIATNSSKLDNRQSSTEPPPATTTATTNVTATKV